MNVCVVANIDTDVSAAAKNKNVTGLQVRRADGITTLHLTVGCARKGDAEIFIHILHKTAAVKPIGGGTTVDIGNANKVFGIFYHVLAGRSRGGLFCHGFCRCGFGGGDAYIITVNISGFVTVLDFTPAALVPNNCNVLPIGELANNGVVWCCADIQGVGGDITGVSISDGGYKKYGGDYENRISFLSHKINLSFTGRPGQFSLT